MNTIMERGGRETFMILQGKNFLLSNKLHFTGIG
jgi:hypothetical protein